MNQLLVLTASFLTSGSIQAENFLVCFIRARKAWIVSNYKHWPCRTFGGTLPVRRRLTVCVHIIYLIVTKEEYSAKLSC